MSATDTRAERFDSNNRSFGERFEFGANGPAHGLAREAGRSISRPLAFGRFPRGFSLIPYRYSSSRASAQAPPSSRSGSANSQQFGWNSESRWRTWRHELPSLLRFERASAPRSHLWSPYPELPRSRTPTQAGLPAANSQSHVRRVVVEFTPVRFASLMVRGRR